MAIFRSLPLLPRTDVTGLDHLLCFLCWLGEEMMHAYTMACLPKEEVLKATNTDDGMEEQSLSSGIGRGQ